MHFSGKVLGCHGEAFVTSDQKDKGEQKPTKLLNTTFVMHETGRSTPPHAEGEEEKKEYIYIHTQPKGSEDLKPRGLSPNNPISSRAALAIGPGNYSLGKLVTLSISPAHARTRPCLATARNFSGEFQHLDPKASPVQARQSVLQMCLLNIFNIAVVGREMQSHPSHTSSPARRDRGYKPVFVSFPKNDQDTGLAAQITRALWGQAMVISLCALEAFSVAGPARGTWQEYTSCRAASAPVRRDLVLTAGAEQV